MPGCFSPNCGSQPPFPAACGALSFKHADKELFYLDERAADEKIAIRARRLHRYLTQPFPGLETFTDQLGAYVPAAETVATCRAILDGVYDEVEEGEFLFKTSFSG